MIWIDFDPVKHEGKPLYESVSRETEIDGETARVFEVVPAKVSFKVASETPWFYMVEIEETGDVWEESAGPGRGWWGPPIGTHGKGDVGGSQAGQVEGALPASSIVSSGVPSELQGIIDQTWYVQSSKLPAGAAGVAPTTYADGSMLMRTARAKPSRGIVIHEAAHVHQGQLRAKDATRVDKLATDFEGAAKLDAHFWSKDYWRPGQGEEVWSAAAGFKWGDTPWQWNSPNVDAVLVGIYGLEESAGPGRGWWGPPIGTHGTGREKDSSGYAGGGESRAGNAKTIAKGDDTELYRWGNLTDVHSSFLGKRTRSLDMTDRPEWYFAPPSMLKSDSWVETVYGRYLLDRPTLAKAGWSKDPHLKVEGAWRWKPGNLGKGWQDIDDKFVGNSFLSSIKGYEVVSLPKGIKTEMLGDWFTYRTGRKIPITLTSVSNITDPFTEAGPSQHEEE